MMPRAEFRVFGDDTDGAWHILARDGAPEGQPEARTDAYFAVPDRADASLKLRGERLDLKILRGSADGLETWEPSGEEDFPIAPEILYAEFLLPAGVRLDLPAMPLDRARTPRAGARRTGCPRRRGGQAAPPLLAARCHGRARRDTGGGPARPQRGGRGCRPGRGHPCGCGDGPRRSAKHQLPALSGRRVLPDIAPRSMIRAVQSPGDQLTRCADTNRFRRILRSCAARPAPPPGSGADRSG